MIVKTSGLHLQNQSPVFIFKSLLEAAVPAGGKAWKSKRVPAANASLEVMSAGAPWHPYTPFQMSTRDSNDWTRMRKGGGESYLSFAAFFGVQIAYLCRLVASEGPSI